MPGNDGKKFVPNGALLTCNKGVTPTAFIVTPKTVVLYDQMCATELDKIPLVNIMPFGVCACTRTPCVPVPTTWMQVHDDQAIINSARPLLEHSFINCALGGKIEIHFTRAGASAASEENENKRIAEAKAREAEAHKKAAEAKEVSGWLFAAAVVVGVGAIILTGGAAAPALAVIAAGAGIGAGIGGAAGAVEGYKDGGGVWGAVKGGVMGAGVGALAGAAAPFAVGGVAGALMVGSLGMMGKGMYHDYEAYDINPSQDNALTLVADTINVLGIVVAGALGRRGGTPKEEFLYRGDDHIHSHQGKAPGRLKSHIDSEGNLSPANPNGKTSITQHVRGSEPVKSDSPYTSLSEGKGGVSKNYGDNKIKVNKTQLERDINSGKVKDVEIIEHNEVIKAHNENIKAAQERYDNSPTPKNAERLERTRMDRDNSIRDKEVLIKGTVPSEYITIEKN